MFIVAIATISIVCAVGVGVLIGRASPKLLPAAQSIPKLGPYREAATVEGEEAEPVDIIDWSTVQNTQDYLSFKCPKCTQLTNIERPASNDYKMSYCECKMHSRGHFHPRCYYCNYNPVMKTADDKCSPS